MKKNFCAIVILFAAACASTPADEPGMTTMPQSAAPDPRVGELQTQLTELLERIDVLNQRIAQLEETRVAEPTEPASRQVDERPLDDSTTRRLVDSAPRPASPPPPALAQSQPQQPQAALVGAQIAENYRQAIMLFGRGRHADARRGFQGVYDQDPSGDLADNALFWIGETYFAAKDYTNAVRYYQRVVNDYSSENKAPDALFKLAMAQERTGDLSLARRTLQQVIDRFPYSSPASSAKAELERIKF